MSQSRSLPVPAAGTGVVKACLFACTLAAIGVLLPAKAWGQLPSSRLDWLMPAGGSPGASLEVTVGGADLDEASSLWFSHPGITATVKTNETGAPVYGTFVVAIDAAVPEGVYETRVTGRFGQSNVRRFAVDRLTGVVDSGANRSLENAQTVSLESIIDGRLEPNEKDFYRVAVTAGQHLLLEAIASDLDSKATCTIEVLDGEGNELAKGRGVPGSSTRLEYTATVDGVLVIAVQDLLYQGSADHFYRLKIHTGPQIHQVSPGIIAAGQPASVVVSGRGLTGAASTTLEQVTVAVDPAASHEGRVSPLPIAALDELAWAEARVTNAAGRTASIPLIVSDLPILAETESEDEWSDKPTATSLTLPCVVDGRFAEENDRDWYEFTAKAGERWWVDVFAHRLGMRADVALTVYQMTAAADGSLQATQLTFVDDPGDRAALIGSDFDLSTDDPAFTFQAPADGTYRIALDDQFGGNRADASVRYVLRFRPERPRARLVVTPALGRPANDQQAIPGTLEVRRGGTERLTVLLQRLEGFADAVTVSVEGLPPGVTCDPVVIAPFSASAMLVVRAADDAADWQGPIRIVGRYGDAAAPVETTALVGTLGFGTDNRALRSALPRLSHQAHLSVVAAETEPVVVRLGETRIVGSRGARVELPVTIERRLGFEGQVVLNPVGQHGELKPAPITFEPGVTQLNLVFDMTSGNLPAGMHQTVLQGDITFKYVRRADLVTAAEAQQAQVAAEIAQLEAEKAAATTFLAGYEAAAAAVAQRLAETAAQRDAAIAATTQAAARLVPATEAGDAATIESALQDIEAAIAARRLALHSLTKVEAESQSLAATKAQHDATIARVDPAIAEAQARKTAIDQQVEQVRQANQPADRVYTVVSPQIEVQVDPSPIRVTVEGISLAAGGSGVLTLQVERRFGYAGPVTIAATTTDGSGVTIGGGEVPADQDRLEVPVTIAPEAAAGTVIGTIKSTVNFNNLPLESTTSVPVTIVPGS